MLTHASTWMNFEDIVLMGENQSQKNKKLYISLPPSPSLPLHRPLLSRASSMSPLLQEAFSDCVAS